MKNTPFISMRKISKSFPLVQANDSIDFDVFAHEIHALLGENGAGKSTLMKILYGFYRADSGDIVYNGDPVAIRSPKDARDLHIGMVFQDLSVIPALSVTENIALFLKDLPFFYKNDSVRSEILDISKRYGLDIDPDQKASALSIGELQKVEIIKLLLSESKLFILDEPTRVLAPHEVESLFTILRNLKEDGYAIILITHKLHEVMAFADRVTVLRKGKVSGILHRAELTENRLIELMFQKSVVFADKQKPEDRSSSPPLLKLSAIETDGGLSGTSLKDLNLEVFPGEILGIAGVSGNGQKELGEVVLGMEPIKSGQKYIFGQDASNWSIGELRKKGVAFIPESPLHMAVAGWLPVLPNMILTRMWMYKIWGGLKIDWNKARLDTENAFQKFGFEIPQLFTTASSLSGGNLQRLTIARELYLSPKLIVASYLTRGLDVQSTTAAHQALRDSRNNGSGILLISEDLDELLLLCDRIAVIYEGKIVAKYFADKVKIDEIGHLMTGSKVINE